MIQSFSKERESILRGVVAARSVYIESLVGGMLAAGLDACIGVGSGPALAQQLAEAAPRVLLLDVDLDGRHAGLAQLLDGHVPPAVATVLVTAELDAETLALVRRAGAAGCLVWPFSQAQLDATLCIALASPRVPLASLEHEVSQAMGVLQRVAGELERARHRVPDPEPPRRPVAGLAELSAREWDVLEGLLDHMRVPDLARALHISPHTVRNHLKAIFAKLGVHSQAELMDKVLDRDKAGAGPLAPPPTARRALRVVQPA